MVFRPKPIVTIGNLPMVFSTAFQQFNNWSLSMICQNMLISLCHLTTFTFTQLPDLFLISSWHCVILRLEKVKVFKNQLWFYVVCHTIFNNFPWRKPTRACFGPIDNTRKIRIIFWLKTIKYYWQFDCFFTLLFQLSKLDMNFSILSALKIG